MLRAARVTAVSAFQTYEAELQSLSILPLNSFLHDHFPFVAVIASNHRLPLCHLNKDFAFCCVSLAF